MVFNAIVNIGFLVPFFIVLGNDIAKAKDDSTSTAVEIIAGMGPNTDGGIPHVSLWNADGKRMGQAMPKKGAKLAKGASTMDSDKTAIHVKDNLNSGGQPEYILLTTVDDDALCITQVTVSGHGIEWTWMGDINWQCGGDWYPSTAKSGNDNWQPKCAWIDANHSDNLRYIAISMHMPDFNPDKGLIDEYNDHPDNLCHSKARFMQWGELAVNPGFNAIPPMFSPALQYNDDGSDKDFDALFKPGWKDKRDDALNAPGNYTADMNGKIAQPGHVVISDYNAHSAEEVCGSESSRGPSFVSMRENVYCDMESKTHYPLCSTTVTGNCFDVDEMHLLGEPRKHARDLSARNVQKRYVTSERWTPEQ